MTGRAEIEKFLTAFPVYEYAFFPPSALSFSERVRSVCESECEMFGRSWSCPPAVGSLRECKAKCLSYSDGLLFSTVSENADTDFFSNIGGLRAEHEKITDEIEKYIRTARGGALALSSYACKRCANCAFPGDKCRNAHIMRPCVESYCILVTELCEKLSMSYNSRGGTLLWFSVILF